MKLKILTQGHFDGFCLLYSIMNSYKALINPNQNAAKFASDNFRKWQKIISITPSLHNFASGEGSDFGVTKNSTDICLKERFINDCFYVLTEGMKSKISSSRLTHEKIHEIDFSKSTIIICVNENAQLEHGSVGDHWISIVGIDEENCKFLVCCSFSHHEQFTIERNDEITGRIYNNTIHFSELKKSKIYVNSIQLVSIESA